MHVRHNRKRLVLRNLLFVLWLLLVYAILHYDSFVLETIEIAFINCNQLRNSTIVIALLACV